MALLSPTAPWRLIGAATAWPVTSQQRACRNALVGCTALAAQRQERLEVEDFLASYDAPPAAASADRTA